MLRNNSELVSSRETNQKQSSSSSSYSCRVMITLARARCFLLFSRFASSRDYSCSTTTKTASRASNNSTLALIIYIFNASVQTVRYSKCLHFQPSKSSSSYPLEAYERTHRERQKFKTNAFSFTCCSQQGESSFLFWSVLFFSMLVSVRPPLTFSTTRKKKLSRERKTERRGRAEKRDFFFFSR